MNKTESLIILFYMCFLAICMYKMLNEPRLKDKPEKLHDSLGMKVNRIPCNSIAPDEEDFYASAYKKYLLILYGLGEHKD